MPSGHGKIDIYINVYLEKINVQAPLPPHSPSSLSQKAADKIRNIFFLFFFHLAETLDVITGCQEKGGIMTLFFSITFQKNSIILHMMEVKSL